MLAVLCTVWIQWLQQPKDWEGGAAGTGPWKSKCEECGRGGGGRTDRVERDLGKLGRPLCLLELYSFFCSFAVFLFVCITSFILIHFFFLKFHESKRFFGPLSIAEAKLSFGIRTFMDFSRDLAFISKILFLVN